MEGAHVERKVMVGPSAAWGPSEPRAEARAAVNGRAFFPPHKFHLGTTRWDSSGPCHVLDLERHGHLSGYPSRSGLLPLHHKLPLNSDASAYSNSSPPA